MTSLKTSGESAISSRKRFKRNTSSLRRRLLFVLLVLIIGAWTITAGTSYIKTRQEIETLFDAQLAQVVYALLEISPRHGTADNIKTSHHIEQQIPSQPYSKKIAFQIWHKDHLFLHSDNAPETRMTQQEHYHNTIIEGKAWRVFAIAHDDVLVEVGEDMEIRDQLIRSIVLDVTLPMLFALPLLASIIWAGIGAGLAPIEKIATAIRSRSHHQLDLIEISDTPQEIQPLLDELNELLMRLEEAFASERDFTANASHELRTPLSVIKTQAQVALRSRNNKELKENLQKIITGVDRATHMVSQLLTLARIDPHAASSLHKPVNLKDVASHIIAELAPLALNKKINISLNSKETPIISSYHEGLQLMLTNLIDNAIRYTPENGTIDVRIEETPDSILLAVSDDGPGIPRELRNKVFDRFYRMPGTKSNGCGIGLAIVKRIAELHNIEIFLDAPQKGSGLIVNVLFQKFRNR